MGKKKGAVRQMHPQKSFEQYLAEATLAKFQGYIDNEIQGVANAIIQHTRQQSTELKTRLVVLEELLMEKFPGLTRDDLVDRIVVLEDKTEGYALVNEPAKLGDRVRVELSSKQSDAKEYGQASRLCVNNAGSGETLGKELEESLLGLSAGETREVVFGKDGAFSAKLAVNRVSRSTKPAQAPAPEAPKAPESPTPEAPNASENAG